MADASLVQYANNPFGDLSMHERTPVYIPVLMRTWMQRVKWNRFVSAQIDTTNSSMRARQIVLTRQVFGRPDFSPKTPMTLFFEQGTFMSLERKTVEIEYHYDNVNIHRDTDLWNYLNASLESMARGGLAWNMIQYMEFLARRAALASSYQMYPSGVTTFDGLSSAANHKFQLEWVDQILLGMEMEDLIDSEDGTPRVACLTTAGVVHDISTQAGGQWIAINSYTESGYQKLNTYGVSGVYKGVVFIPVPVNVLWAAGPITAQTTITAPVNVLDGVLATADAHGFIGKQGSAKEFVTVASAASLAANDVVVLHRTRTNAYGVTNGVDPNEGTADVMQIRSINGLNISFYRPWLKKPFDEVVPGTSVYGYLTKAAPVHMSSFIADENAIQIGVAQPIAMYEAPAIDSAMKMKRFSWDGYLVYNLMNHPGVRNVFTRGSVVNPRQMAISG